MSSSTSSLYEKSSFRSLYGRPLFKIFLGAVVVNAGLKWAWYSLELERKDISYANRIALLESELKQAIEEQRSMKSQKSPSIAPELDFYISGQSSQFDSNKPWWKLW
ncbi:hypothetical protein NADFUDRAFT_52457 [Nadsonia fulvescens var. elongata DSM 6958]|uniref:Uncharacterized protein n=1 Tax=Nadsonia fulvescens var. elongata DSM 6958 TaxID=857566 RepID=A0A1E3PHF9_9ASCO|nr:hypothetical protein NADFUDRAFT_52457 [Nadsonia fulvescens var. elongata DSM 6958]